MRTRDKTAFLVLFFLSGACGLTYEIVWSRLLVFVFGGATFAITTVLTCFMGGLALGSWLAGRASVRRAERLYGVLEIFIGVTALLVPFFLDLGTGLYRALVQGVSDDFLLLTGARVLVCAIVLLLPTTAMGATLPLLASAFTRHRGRDGETQVGGSIAALYGSNTFGAFVGCAGAGFFLLPTLGLDGATLTVALLNFFCGTSALLLSLRPDPEEDAPTPEAAEADEKAATAEEEPAPKKKGKKKKKKKKAAKKKAVEAPAVLPVPLLLLLYGLSGFAAMAYQIAWTRALILSMGSSTYSFSTIVSCYIFGLAAGSLVMTRWVDRLRQPLSVAGLLQAVIALAALFVVPLFGELPGVVAQATTAADASFAGILLLEALWVFGLLIAPTFCMGALLPLVCRVYTLAVSAREAAEEHAPHQKAAHQKAARSVGDVYASNTAGTILGSALAGFVLIPWIGMEQTIRVASTLNLLVATLFFLVPRPRPARRLAVVAGAWILAFASTGVTEPWSREVMTSGPYLGRTGKDTGWELVFYRDGIDATVSVEKSAEGHLSLSVNGKADASTLKDDMLTQSLAGAIPMLLRPDAKDACLIGLGSGVTAGAMLAFDLEHLDLAEISQAVVDGSRLFDETSEAPLDDPRVGLHRADGRNFLLLTDRTYDVIVSEPSNPWISGIANLFTKEFFELSKSRLKPGGVHAQWLHGYSMAPENFAAVLHTLTEVFGHVEVWEMAMNDYLMVASAEPIRIDVEEMFFSFSRPPLRKMLEKIHITSPLQVAYHYIGNSRRMSAWLDGSRLLTDTLPYLEFSAPRYLLETTDVDVAERLYSFAGEPPVMDSALAERFSKVAELTRDRAEHYRSSLRAARQGDFTAHVAALHAVVDAAPEDLRTLHEVMAQAVLLARAGARSDASFRDLEARLNEIDAGRWPFNHEKPWPMPEAFAYAGRKLLDEGGDPVEASEHLLRAWLRAPSDAGILRDLARAYEMRGEMKQAARLRALAAASPPASAPDGGAE